VEIQSFGERPNDTACTGRRWHESLTAAVLSRRLPDLGGGVGKMRNQMRARAIVMLALVCASFVSSAQTPGASQRDALVDLLVWGAEPQIDPKAYPAAVKAELEKHLQRSRDYRPARRPATNSSEQQMVSAAEVRYERRLVAVTDDPRAPALAVAYVDGLRPCYEWEGHHECPEREAAFATQYQTANAGGPFSEFLPLLAAHRWLCAAEAYEYEKQPDGVSRSRRAYEQAIAIARQSKALLVRTAAEELLARGRCSALR